MADGTVTIAVELDDGSVVKGVADLKQYFNEMGTQSENGANRMNSALANGAGFAIAQKGLDMIINGVKEFAQASVGSAGNFEQTMNMVQANTNASSGEMSNLTQLAKDLGASTKFSANEAATAILELTKAGLTPAEVQAGALKATMNLAAASGMELGDAANITANALNTFHLSADKANVVANALAGGANASSADVSDLAEALSQVGPGAATAGMSLNETVGALAAFSQNGMKGSDAGTSLKTMLSSLVPTTKSAQAAMDQYGLSFTDANGNIDDMTTVAGKLHDKLGGLSEAQKQTALSTIFGSDAARAGAIMVSEGADGIQKYIKATEDQAAAQKMADAYMKGFKGTMEQLSGALETVAMSIGSMLLPGLTLLAKGLSNAIDWLSDGSSTAQIVTGSLTALGVGLTAVLAGVVAFGVLPSVTAAFGAFNAILAANPIILVVGSLAALAAGLSFFFTQTTAGKKAWAEFMDYFNSNKDWITSLIVALGAGVAAFVALKVAMNISGVITTVISSISSMVETMQILWLLMLDNPFTLIVVGIAALVAGLTYFFTQTKSGQAIWSSFTSFLVSAWQSASGFISSAMQVINSAFQRMMDYLSPLISSISAWLGSLAPVGGVFAGISGPMGTVIGLIDKFGPLIISLVAPIGLVGKLLLQFAAAFIQTGNASDAIGLMASNFTSLVTNILGGLTTVINGLTSVLPSIIQFGVNIITTLIQGIVSALPQIIQAMTGVITQLTGALTTALPLIVQGGIQLINGLMQAIVGALPSLVQAFTAGIQSLVTGLTALLPELVNGGVQIIMALLGAIVAALPMLISAAVQIIMALVNGLIANLPQIINAGIQLITALLNAFVTMLPLLINAAVQIIMALVNGLIANLPQIINAAIQLITALVNGFITMLPMLITAAIQIIMALVNGLIQNLPQIINAGIQLIMALINGLIQVLPQLVMAAFQLIVALVGAIIQMVPQLLAAGVQLIMALISGIGSLLGTLIQAGANLIVQMLSAIGGFLGNMGSMGSNLITSLIGGISGLIGNVASTVGKGVSNAVNSVKDFFGDMKEAAGYMVSGLVKGIEDKISDVVNAAKDMGKKAVDGVKSFLNIHSPSRVMRDEVGQYIPLGVAAGIDRYSGKAVDSMKAMSRKLTMVKPSATIDFGSQGGLTQARQIMQNQLSITGDSDSKQDPVANTANVNITNIVRDNPSEVEQARITRNEMRKMGYDLAY